MIETTSPAQETLIQHWSQQLQRRTMRLLLQHDEPLFRNQFRLFFVESTLPQIPLLQQYDQYIKLQVLSNQLLDDIMPRIRRQLSLKTSHARLQEESPTRGDIDWPRTIERGWHRAPGLPPLLFDTRLRQRSLDTPENLLAVAILLAYRQELQHAMQHNFTDEELTIQECQVFVSADEHTQRELAAPYARTLTEQARRVHIPTLAQEVTTHLRPGPSAYRDLLAWWQRFTHFRVGRSNEARNHSLASKRSDEKTDAWLYELWIVLECIHLLHQQAAVEVQDMQIATDLLQCTFTWQQRRFRLLYNRQLDTSTTYVPDWEHGPSSRPDYTIERETPLEIRHEGALIWREPSIVLDAKYYLNGTDPTHTHGPIKKLLGDMTLLGAQVGALFFPLLPEPVGAQQATRVIQRMGRQYTQTGLVSQQIHLYHLEPSLPLTDLQHRLAAILDLATEHLPDRPEPLCQGIWPDPDTINASHHTFPPQTILCPKPHIGAGVYDLVHIDTDCLKNPLLCHIMDQPIVPPFVLRITTHEQLARQNSNLRTHSNERLRQAESVGDEARAEQLRMHIFTGVGRTVEQYVKLLGNAAGVEENFERWAFGDYWKKHPRCLSETTRHSLVSGEQVWQSYQEISLQDWAAPAIQYCRALEFELRRRLYDPCQSRYPAHTHFTLGTVTHAHTKRQTDKNAREIWDVFLWCIAQSGSSESEFEQVIQQLCAEHISEKRNQLAHGSTISRELASSLRENIIGDRTRPGLLYWLAEHVHPA